MQPIAVSDRARQIFHDGLAPHCLDEARGWPSHKLIAQRLGCDQSTVNRAIRELIEAGWPRIVEKRWSPRPMDAQRL